MENYKCEECGCVTDITLTCQHCGKEICFTCSHVEEGETYCTECYEAYED